MTGTIAPEPLSGPAAECVVCVGSSAGGLEALFEMLRSLPVDLPFVYVIAQHLSPTQVSPMAELLARQTPLAVRFAEDGARLDAGVILIGPPNTDIEVGVDAVRVMAPSTGIGPHPSVDRLLRSAASARGERCVAVVLSGTGHDGSDGVMAVRAAGGTTIAERPESARFPGMPSSAAATGAIDLVLTPAEVGPALRRVALVQGKGFVDPPPERADTAPADVAGLDDAVTEDIASVVHAATGLDFSGYKRGTLRRQIGRRMALMQVPDAAHYLLVLAADPGEARQLGAALLVPVTSFFRDASAWTALDEPLRDLVAGLDEGQQLRIWVPGCATGQEAYTVGMLAAELLGRPADLVHRLKIFATDLNENTLEVARRGRYAANDLGPVPAELRSRWLRECRHGWDVDPALRQGFVFARHDVAVDPPFPRIHLVSLRNTMIYFDPALQERVLRLLHFGLVPDGLLLLGGSERIAAGHDLFDPVNASARIYRRRASRTLGPVSALAPETGAAAPRHREPVVTSRHSTEDRDALRDALIRRFAPASVVIDARDDVVEVVGEVSRWCWVADGQHSSQVVALLRQELRPAVRGLLLRLRHGGSDPVERSVTIGDGIVLVSAGRLDDGADERIVVSFRDPPSGGAGAAEPAPRDVTAGTEFQLMAQELASTEDALQASIEELTASNEELQALNEELQASAEELQASSEEVQASNEELEAVNEELSSLNSELRVRSDALATANADLEDVQASLTSGLVLVDRELRVTRYTALAVRIFALIESDLGRPLTAVPRTLDVPDLEGLLRTAVDDEKGSLVEVRSDRADVLLQFQPHLGADGTVQGVIVVTTDVTEVSDTHRAARRTLRELTTVTDALPEVVWQHDAAGRLVFVNARVERLFGVSRERVLADPSLLSEAVHPDDRDRVVAARAAAGSQRYQVEYRIVRPRGEIRWVTESGVDVRADASGPGCAVATVLDVTDVHEASRRVQDRLAILDSLYENSLFGVVLVDGHDRILAANGHFAAMTGYDRAALAGMPLMLQPEPEDQPDAQEPGSSDDVAGPPPAQLSRPVNRRLVARDGSTYRVAVEVRPLRDGDRSRRILVVNDVTGLYEVNEALTAQARFDRQTGLPARTHFRALLSEQLARAARSRTGLALLWIDLDGFKEVNDRYGHRAGDAALREVADRLQKTARAVDTVGRLGGDEFAMLVADVGHGDNLEFVADRVLTVLREPILIDDSPVFVSGSIGVAVAPQDGADAEVLLHHANIAMYAAKQDGRDRRAYFRAEMDALAESRADLRHGLASAVRRREFVVHYQPILDARTGAVASVEALVRWQREGRAVPATDFLGLAEETGQLTAIGQLAAGIIDGDLGVLDAALAGESPGRPPALCVNVSSQQLDERHFVDWLLAWKPPGGYGRVVVEVTESAALARGGRAVEALGVLRRLGARLSIDDFGTGYSNLEILERLRPDVVKIDRSLLIRGQETPWGFTVLRAAVQLGHAMEAEVVVEGVENEALLQLTRTLDAEYLQGYHLAEPMAVADLARWCSRRRTS